MSINETLAILKLASKFLNPKDYRGFMNHVQIIKNHETDTISFLASNGHIAIRIMRKGTCYSDHINLPEQVTFESITKAAKVNAMELLSKGEHEARFPDYEKCFRREDQYELDTVGFDCSYLALIFTALETFRKDMKIKLARVVMQPISDDKQNFMSLRFYEDTSSEIKIDIAIMPLKG